MGGWAWKKEGEESPEQSWQTPAVPVVGRDCLSLECLEAVKPCFEGLFKEYLRSRKQKTSNIFQSWQKNHGSLLPLKWWKMIWERAAAEGRSGWVRHSDWKLLLKPSVNQGCTKTRVPVCTASVHLRRATLERSKGCFVFLFGEPTQSCLRVEWEWVCDVPFLPRIILLTLRPRSQETIRLC